ncbi:TetR/AcrR family transcriptional regulator [Nonomuraea basaltis]|uniref:TetR/AcrR family transcriptional regulator n=1 Tax=Nonomuraea basaltis TaxID=2495887 RepID=UPI00110C4E31|nr:TetR/AcrR family transcriptional regulator [Nonomuraea basaltis]TMR96821.1 TetR/AcrR family transcriptional regulator [Nonomuraea basaltis]
MSETSVRRRPGGRSARVRRALFDATIEVLHQHGASGLTVREVATRAGVNEASVYRRFGTRENLMIEALLSHSEQLLPIPDTGSLHGDLVAFATEISAYVTSPLGSALLRVLAAAGDDPAVDRVREQFARGRFTLAGDIVTRAIARGELPDTTDARLVLEMLIAPLHLRALLTREPIDDEAPRRLADAIVRGFGARPDTTGAQHG